MKVHVTWEAENPFKPSSGPRTALANLPDKMSYDQIEKYAKKASPKGYYLKKVSTPEKEYIYDREGNKKEQ